MTKLTSNVLVLQWLLYYIQQMQIQTPELEINQGPQLNNRQKKFNGEIQGVTEYPDELF